MYTQPSKNSPKPKFSFQNKFIKQNFADVTINAYLCAKIDQFK